MASLLDLATVAPVYRTIASHFETVEDALHLAKTCRTWYAALEELIRAAPPQLNRSIGYETPAHLRIPLMMGVPADQMRYIHSWLVGKHCGAGHLEAAQWLVDQHELNQTGSTVSWIFLGACEAGHLHVAQWMAKRYKITKDDLWTSDGGEEYNVFAAVCEEGHIEIAKWLIKDFDLVASTDVTVIYQALQGTIYNGHIEVAQMLVETFQLEDTKVLATCADALGAACEAGHIDQVQWYLTQYNQTKENMPEPQQRSLFIHACAGGHLNLAKWLDARFNVRKTEARQAYHAACVGGGWLEVMRWVSEEESDFDFDFGSKFILACSCNHLHIAQWIAQRANITRENSMERVLAAFKAACQFGCLETIVWITIHFAIKLSDLASDEYEAYRRARLQHHRKVIEWLEKNGLSE